MYGSKLPLWAISNRHLCPDGDLLKQLSIILPQKPAALVLREKDLSEEAYLALARQVQPLCAQYQVPLIFHTFISAAKALGGTAIHLPLPLLLSLSAEEKAPFSTIGTSIHAVEEVEQAEAAGATYLMAGHIFPTDCKAGLAPRGLSFLQSVLDATSLPVYAIGGVGANTLPLLEESGCAGACMMSQWMKQGAL